MRKLILLGLICINAFVNAQQTSDDSLLLKPVSQNLIGEKYSDPGFTHKGIHFREEFLPGNVCFITGDSVCDLSLRYNTFEDQLVWLSKKHGQIKLDQLNIAQFSFKTGDTAFIFKKVPALDPGFVQVGYEGRIMLYIKRKSVPYTSYIRNSIKYYKYRPAPAYFLVVNGKIYNISRNIKNLYQLFPGKEEAIRNSIKGKRLKFKRENDFLKAIVGMEKILVER